MARRPHRDHLAALGGGRPLVPGRLATCLRTLLVALVLGACAAPPASPSAPTGAASSPAPAPVKRMVAAIASQPVGVSQAVTRAVLAYSVNRPGYGRDSNS